MFLFVSHDHVKFLIVIKNIINICEYVLELTSSSELNRIFKI